ncbi:ABC transporter ATP-binding protein [Streptosporangium sp. NBC_01755]|uniref:ABC transporter ATP-binding protein n=1 Tax=unclassified Streptosporangium TaxID=2632669 RepID=UPI002DD90676|nr:MULTISPECIES: ABC transporter ATP-binding protein [unclassified Streptosporangium]WSA26598.1 ABC transporter ATP-binding protein [Streptosporangium sp. NBC_01810]WSD01978.1 ABC transporter ATP-binding protein [Streptosporangium sp. NBC_01755]
MMRQPEAPDKGQITSEAFLKMLGISKRYPGVVANEDVTFEVLRGEIHALLGENGAGKSTLMKILDGVVQADEGSIHVNGRQVTIRRPRDAQQLGIGMVHQHFMLVADMTVTENIALTAPGHLAAGSDLAGVRDRFTRLAEQHRLEVDPDARISELSVGERQRVEIVKLLYRDAELLILDEPTAVLTRGEWQHLATVLRDLARQGKSVIIITHKLGEVFEVADRCTVLRGGKVVGAVTTAEATVKDLVRMMVGREVLLRVPRAEVEPGPVMLDVQGVHLRDADGRVRLDDINLQVRAGEVVGVAGVEGNGQSELVDILAGARQPSRGRVQIGDVEIERLDPSLVAAAGTAVIPEDRHRDAVALSLSMVDNLMVKSLGDDRFVRSGILRRRAIRDHCRKLISDYDIRVPGLDVRMRQLSGGNQQKAVVARELERSPKFLIAAQPTRGLDIGAMEFVYRCVNRHREQGGATLLVSSELDEILTLSDRVVVMVRGRIVGVLVGDEATSETIGHLMSGAAEAMA